MDQVEQSTPSADIDVDSLLAEIEAPAPQAERPMSEPPAPAPQAAPQTAPQAPQEFEINYKGQTIKAPVDRVKQWAQQGYDYAQKMSEFTKQQQEFQTRSEQIAELEKRYGPVDEYVRQNPEFWEHVMQSYQQKQQAFDPNNPLVGKLSLLEQKLQEIDQFKNTVISEKQAQQRQEQDQALDRDIQSIRETYKDLDWNTVDTDGKTLEIKILEHANAQGIRNFRAAFRDFYHDHLVKMAEERGKELVNKDIQKKTKLGFLGTSETPKKSLSQAQDVKSKSYEDLLAEALDEVGHRSA